MKFVGLLVFSNLFKYALFQQSGIYLPVAADSAWWIAHLYIQSFLHQINKQEENYLLLRPDAWIQLQTLSKHMLFWFDVNL